MNKLLKDLYDCFYTPPELAATKREIEECHRALIEALGKPERRLVLKIIDAKDHISEDTSLDSFISGFRLAWRLSAELNHYDDERPARCQAAEKPGARFTLKKEDDEAHRDSCDHRLLGPVCRCVAAARHKGGTTRPNTNARRSCSENGCCDNGRKEKYGNAAGRAGRGAWRRSCPRTGRVDACGRNAAAGAYASHTAADHRTAAQRRGLYSGLWLGTIRGAESPRVCRGYVRKWQ